MDNNKKIEQLYLEHKDHVYNFLARMANDPELAMDVTQQTFVKALSDKNFYTVENPKAYLFTIARNTLYNEFKRKKATSLDAIEEAGDFEAKDESEGVHDSIELRDLQSKVEKSIKRMPAKTKELMILRYTEDLSIKEIVEVTGRSLSDVKVNLHRARIKFESSFTNEMYAKVAASRDQCETLTTLLEPHVNSEIPEQHLQLVDKHISSCKICYEDAEQLKRSRVLFNLGALIAAPYILNEMMSEAMASEFSFMTGTGSSNSATMTTNMAGKTTASSAAKSATTKIVATKIISTKVAAMIAVVTVVGIGGLIVLNTLSKKDEDIVAIVNQAPVTPPPAPVIPPTPTAKPKVKLDPDATTIVSFKARNKKTGKYILQGLKWDIYNTADSNGKSKTGKPKLIHSSTTPNYNVILDSGYYLAKVTYKGKTQQSEFNVKDDNPVNIELSFGTSKINLTAGLDKTKFPTIHIRRKETGSHESNPLKVTRDLCIKTIELYKMTRAQSQQGWARQEKSLKRRTPDFNLNRGIAPEPDWSKLTENYEDEYFSGNKYALYKKGKKYKVSDDGSCKIIATEYETAEIDDGQFQYHVDFKEKTADKATSEAVNAKQMQDRFKDYAEDSPFVTQAMGKMFSEAILGKPGSSQEKQSKDAINKLTELTKVAGTETILGETCEYDHMGEQMGVRICYWKPMHEYPTIMKRKIVLKQSIGLNKGGKPSFFGKSNTEAILFEKDIVLANKIFSVPSNITINNTDY